MLRLESHETFASTISAGSNARCSANNISKFGFERIELQASKPAVPEDRIIFGERDIGIKLWQSGPDAPSRSRVQGASSHSGPRTFITSAAQQCIEGRGSLRDVQQLAEAFKSGDDAPIALRRSLAVANSAPM
jgi:hypothetical protein